MNGKWWLATGAVLGLLSVGLGAFGAHGLQQQVKQWGLDEAAQAKRLADWEVASRYQMYHALALLAVGALAGPQGNRRWNIAGGAFCVGVLLFSGCLYAYVLTGIRIWALVVPVGGTAFLIGWLASWPPSSQKASVGEK